MIFRLYTVYKKHGMIKVGSQTREKRKYITSAKMILLPIVLPEIYFMYSTKESKNKDVEIIFCYGKFSENEQEEISITVDSKIN